MKTFRDTLRGRCIPKFARKQAVAKLSTGNSVDGVPNGASISFAAKRVA